MRKLPTPIGMKVLIAPDESKSHSGLIEIPEAFREKAREGTIIKLGTGDRSKKKKFEVKAGDRVLFAKFGASEMMVGGEVYAMVHADDILMMLF